MSAVVEAVLATVLFLAIGEGTERDLGFEWYSALEMGACRRQEEYRKHARLLDAEPCITKLFNPPSSLDKDEDAPPVPEQGYKLYEPEWVPADQPTSNEPLLGHWLKLRLQVAESEAPPPPPIRVRARRSSPSAAAPAWAPGSIPAFAGQVLGAIEGHVRALAGGLFSRLNIISTLSAR